MRLGESSGIVCLNVSQVKQALLIRFEGKLGASSTWLKDRKDALLPSPVEEVFSVLYKGDRKVDVSIQCDGSFC